MEIIKKLKTIRATILIICCFGTIPFLIGCNNSDDEKPICGCKSGTLDTVPSKYSPEEPQPGEQESGLLFFNQAENVGAAFNALNNEKKYNSFWILMDKSDFPLYSKILLHVCNKNLLGSKFDFLKNNMNDSIPVTLSGDVKNLCNYKKGLISTEYYYLNIRLSSIEKND